MSFGKRSSGHGMGGGSGHGDDLMITPLLDLFVALIPFLILSVVMSRINVVDVGISKPVMSKVSAPANDLDLTLKVSAVKAEIFIKGRLEQSIDLKDNVAAVEKIHAKLVEIKRKNIEEFKIRIEPQGEAKLELVMSIMDAARKLSPTDGEITRKNEKGETIKLQFLFPNVILKGVYS